MRHPRTPDRLRRLAAVLTACLGAALLVAFVPAGSASAHGSTIDPASRNYSCWKRWGSRHQDPAMATQDPMCWQAWQADPNAMWNWNGLYIDGVGGKHQQAVPDGQLCSAGGTSDGRYAALDKPGQWTATPVGTNFGVTLHDQARHGADYFRIYVTKQGFDPTRQRLAWGDLELVKETGKYAPGAGETSTDPVLNGVQNTIQVSAPGRTGRHIVYTIWKASHSDQTYYLCADVTFGGSGQPVPDPTTPAPDPTTPAPDPTTPQPDPTTPAPDPTTPQPDPTIPEPDPTTAPEPGACAATYRLVNSWPGGYLASVSVQAGSAVTGWKVTWPAGQETVNHLWNGKYSRGEGVHTVTNADYNGSLQASGGTEFGFLGAGEPPASAQLECAAA